MKKLNGNEDLTLVAFCITLTDPMEIKRYLTAYLWINSAGEHLRLRVHQSQQWNQTARTLGNHKQQQERPQKEGCKIIIIISTIITAQFHSIADYHRFHLLAAVQSLDPPLALPLLATNDPATPNAIKAFSPFTSSYNFPNDAATSPPSWLPEMSAKNGILEV